MTKADLTLSYIDGRPSTVGIKAVNEVLRTVGVHASRTPSPPEARPILEASKTRALSEDEQAQLPDGAVVKLSVPVVETGGPAWRLSYPGKRPHGAFLDAEHGLIVAYAHGPEKFVMRYEVPSAQGPEALATNPWIDFGGDAPRLLDDVTVV